MAQESRLYFPYGDERHAPVTASDIARVVSAILADPTPHTGKRHVVTGPQNLTLQEMADVIGREVGKPVTYVSLPVEAWQKILVEREGIPEYLAAHLAEVARDHQRGVFNAQTDVVERITGSAPVELEDFVREARELFVTGAVVTAPAA